MQVPVTLAVQPSLTARQRTEKGPAWLCVKSLKLFLIASVPDVKRLCGSGVMGQSELPRGEVGKGGRPAGRGFGCLKLLLSEKSDWDSAAAPSKGERAVRSDTLMGTTRLGLVKPGGGEGESLVGIWGGGDGRARSKSRRHGAHS